MLEKGSNFHKTILIKYISKHLNFENMLNKHLGLNNVTIHKKLNRAIGVYIIKKLNQTNMMEFIE